MEMRRNTAEKQVMEETGGREEGRMEEEESWIMRTLMRGMESSE